MSIVNRNLAILVIAQCVSVGGTILLITVGGIIGVGLAPAPWLATLPVSLMVVGTAVAVFPATWLMSRIGRRRGFVFAALMGAAGALVGAQALVLGSFVLFALAAFILGAQIAFSQQYRFAAAESVAASAAGRAIALVLVGSLGGALIGPEIAARAAAPVAGVVWLGGFLAVAVLYVLAAIMLLALIEPPRPHVHPDDAPARPLRVLLRNPAFFVAVLAGIVGQGIMTFIMTATPVSMHVVDGHGMAETSGVIRAHVLAMYLPSLVSALLIGWLGLLRLMGIGVIAMLVTVGIALQGHDYLHYWWALVLLGVGWNFLFVGGTSLLMQSYLAAERFRSQAFNDFAVFGVAAAGSLLAGSVVVRFGWSTVLWASMPLLLVMAGALVWLAVQSRSGAAPARDVPG